MNWMMRERLAAALDGFVFSDDTSAMAAGFEDTAKQMARTATELRDAGKGAVEHFGDG